MSFAVLTSPRPSLSLFFTTRPALDEIFGLDAANSAYYRLLCIGRYVLLMYGATKALEYCYPQLLSLFNRPRFLSSEEYDGNVYVFIDRWQRAVKVFVTLAIRNASFEYFSRFCYKALDFKAPLSPLDLPSWAIRGVHYLALKIFFKSPSEVMRHAVESAQAAPPTAISHALLFDNTFEARLWRNGYFLFNPVLSSFPCFVRDTASNGGAGSTTRVTGAAYSKYSINSTDVMISFVATSLTDFCMALITYGVIPFVLGKPTAVNLEHRLITISTKLIVFITTNAAITRLVGPTSTPVQVFGREMSPANLCAIGGVFGAILSCFVVNLTIPVWAVAHRWFSGKTQKEVNNQAILRAKKEFHQIVGKEWHKMTQVQLVELVSFNHTIQIEGVPNDALFQFGSAYLCALIEVLDNAAPCRDTLMMRALENGDLVRPNAADLHDPINTLRADSSVFAPEPSTIVDDDPCVVCLKQLKRESDDIVIGARCRHAYHTNCLRECLNLNAKCPLCNTEILKVSEEDVYVVPQFVNEHGPVSFLRFGYEYNDSATELLTRMMRKYSWMQSWELDLNWLTSYVQRFELTTDPVYASLRDILRAIEPNYHKRIQFYGQMLPPYTQIMPAIVYGEGNAPIQTLTTTAVWKLICYCAYLPQAQTLWGEEKL